MDKIIKYIHHGKEVSVKESLKGKHRDHCLCWNCEKFTPEDRKENCSIANRLYQFDINNNVTTPVWECAEFIKLRK